MKKPKALIRMKRVKAPNLINRRIKTETTVKMVSLTPSLSQHQNQL